MYCKIKRLRRGGERIHDREIQADLGVVGHMTICRVDTTTVAKVHAAGDDARKTPMFPELWRAKITAMNADRMLFQGYERVGNQATNATENCGRRSHLRHGLIESLLAATEAAAEMEMADLFCVSDNVALHAAAPRIAGVPKSRQSIALRA
jgi:hypothetical protein